MLDLIGIDKQNKSFSYKAKNGMKVNVRCTGETTNEDRKSIEKTLVDVAVTNIGK